MPNQFRDVRFEVLLKQQDREHRALLNDHAEEMQKIRDSLSSFKDRYESLYQDLEEKLKAKSMYFSEILKGIQNKVSGLESLVADHGKSIVAIFGQINQIYLEHPHNKDLEKTKSDFSGLVSQSMQSNLESLQNMQNEIYKKISEISQEVKDLSLSNDLKFDSIDSEYEKKYCESNLDKSKILSDLKVYDKSIFIMEKKIENLYTLIDRLKGK